MKNGVSIATVPAGALVSTQQLVRTVSLASGDAETIRAAKDFIAKVESRRTEQPVGTPKEEKKR